MNGAHRDPLSPDELDELLSAELDGELDAAAIDLGFESAEAARAAIDATPGASERRAALERAQRVSARDTVVLDDIEREQLVRAVRVARTRSPRRTPVWAAAAAILVAAAAAVAVWRGGTTKDDRNVTAASAPRGDKRSESTAPVAGAADRDLGVVKSNAELRRALHGSSPTPSTESVTPSTGAATVKPQDGTIQAYAAAPACLAGLPGPPGLADVHLVGHVTYKGGVAAVATGRAGRDTVAWAFDPQTCRVELTFSVTGAP